jgi:dTDP-4-amino-4,6-dideoxygalactose transaminase
MQKHNIYVTKPYLPPIEEYISHIKKVWENQYLTNGGPLAQDFEKKLQEYFGVKHVLYVANGTVALQLAMKALNIKKEIITTPFSFAATVSSIIWEKCTPKFVDINATTYCIDSEKIEEAITKDTEAILPVHIYGIPCDVEKIKAIAKKHNLKVIYDAAHTFGSKMNGKSLVDYGDISIISFHATKLFNTGEGGAIITNDDAIAEEVKQLRNFGMQGESIVNEGINAKNSELHAAVGLTILPHVEEIIEQRKKLSEIYDTYLQELPLIRPVRPEGLKYNYAYYPVIFQNTHIVMQVVETLKQDHIYAKRYFYPSLNTLPYVQYQPCPVSESVAQRVLCLPLYYDLTVKDVKHISRILIDVVQHQEVQLEKNEGVYIHKL